MASCCKKLLHVLCDRRVADCVGRGGDGGLAAVAAAAAVQAGHVDSVQVVVVWPPSVAQRVFLAVVVAAPANGKQLCEAATRGTRFPAAIMTMRETQRCHVDTFFIYSLPSFGFETQMRLFLLI